MASVRRIRLTLERKFVIIAAVVMSIAFGTANLWLARAWRARVLHEADERARTASRIAASTFTNALLYESLGLVEDTAIISDYIAELVSDSTLGVVDVRVYDPDGRLVEASSYRAATEHSPAPSRIATIARRVLDQGRTCEIDTPLEVGGRRLGLLCMRFTRVPALAHARAGAHAILLATLAAFGWALLLAALVARTLARPIKVLAAGMLAVRPPEYSATIESFRNDEIGDLQRAFTHMLERLRAFHRERERQHTVMVETERLASVGTLAAGLAHEINNPLSGTRACLRRIAERPDDADQVRRYAQMMDEALARIARLVGDLLDFARRRPLEIGPVNAQRLAERAAALAEPRMRRRRVTLEVSCDPVVGHFEGDAARLEQVLVNLLLNAGDATPEGGRVTLRVGVRGEDVEIVVEDEGPGVDPALRERIFDPFFTTKPVGEGTGLGLAVARSIVAQHGGRIEVHAHEPRGATFRVVLPRARRKPCDDVVAAILAGGRSRRMGRDKALIDVGGVPMIQRVYDVIAPRVRSVAVVGGSPEALGFLGCPVVPDAVPDAGPLGGLYTALRDVAEEWCLLVACDMPLLDGLTVDRLLDARDAAADVIVVQSARGDEPMLALYHRRILPVVERQVASHRRALHDLLDAVVVRRVTLDERVASTTNVNAPEDLERAQRALGDRAERALENDE